MPLYKFMIIISLPHQCFAWIGTVKNLNLWGQNLTDVSILKSLPSLEVVSLALNSLTSLSSFSHLSKLCELYLRRNQISNIHEVQHLSGLKELRILWLCENPIAERSDYRKAVVRAVPWLEVLDDKPVTEVERAAAMRDGEGAMNLETRHGGGGRPGNGFLNSISEDNESPTAFPVHAASPIPPRDIAAPHLPMEDHLRGPGLDIVTMPHQTIDARRRRHVKRWNVTGRGSDSNHDEERRGIEAHGAEGRSDLENELLQTAFHVHPSSSSSSHPFMHASDAVYASSNADVHAAHQRRMDDVDSPSQPMREPNRPVENWPVQEQGRGVGAQPSAAAPSSALTPRGQRNRPSWLGGQDQKRDIKQRIRAASSTDLASKAISYPRGGSTSQFDQPTSTNRADTSLQPDHGSTASPLRSSIGAANSQKPANILFAILSLIKELDVGGLQVVEYEVSKMLRDESTARMGNR
ncbi:hypothetical protein HDV00_008086 [Rhizophlyctis rosea]|nr:hypothetical protein HDV00_008086 [Rhizophlyctis rosea]